MIHAVKNSKTIAKINKTLRLRIKSIVGLGKEPLR
jgi:hypothetical protein